MVRGLRKYSSQMITTTMWLSRVSERDGEIVDDEFEVEIRGRLIADSYYGTGFDNIEAVHLETSDFVNLTKNEQELANDALMKELNEL